MSSPLKAEIQELLAEYPNNPKAWLLVQANRGALPDEDVLRWFGRITGVGLAEELKHLHPFHKEACIDEEVTPEAFHVLAKACRRLKLERPLSEEEEVHAWTHGHFQESLKTAKPEQLRNLQHVEHLAGALAKLPQTPRDVLRSLRKSASWDILFSNPNYPLEPFDLEESPAASCYHPEAPLEHLKKQALRGEVAAISNPRTPVLARCLGAEGRASTAAFTTYLTDSTFPEVAVKRVLGTSRKDWKIRALRHSERQAQALALFTTSLPELEGLFQRGGDVLPFVLWNLNSGKLQGATDKDRAPHAQSIASGLLHSMPEVASKNPWLTPLARETLRQNDTLSPEAKAGLRAREAEDDMYGPPDRAIIQQMLGSGSLKAEVRDLHIASILETLSYLELPCEVMLQLLTNPNTPRAVVLRLSDSTDPVLSETAVEQLTAEETEGLTNEHWTRAVQWASDTSDPDELEELGVHKDARVRRAVAQNPHTNLDALSFLYTDEDCMVSRRVKQALEARGLDPNLNPSRGHSLNVRCTKGSFLHYEHLAETAAVYGHVEMRGGVYILEGAVICGRPSNPVVLQNCTIGEGAVIGPGTTIREGVVAPGARVYRTVHTGDIKEDLGFENITAKDRSLLDNFALDNLAPETSPTTIAKDPPPVEAPATETDPPSALNVVFANILATAVDRAGPKNPMLGSIAKSLRKV